LSNIHIYHNTIVNSEEVRLGGSGNNPPTSVVLANNLFVDPAGQLFDEETESENWLGNLYFGTLGIEAPTTGLANVDPGLTRNTEGYFQPTDTSPAIAAAVAGYPAIPLFPGMDYDNELSLDLLKQSRSVSVPGRTVGAVEYSATASVQPHVNEFNTGPSYLFDNPVDYVTTNTRQIYVDEEGEDRSFLVSSNTDWTVVSDSEWITFGTVAQSGDARVDLRVAANGEATNRSGVVTVSNGVQAVEVTVFQDAGPVSILEQTVDDLVLYPNPSDGEISIRNLPAELREVLLIDVSNLSPGVYLLHLTSPVGHTADYGALTKKIVIN